MITDEIESLKLALAKEKQARAAERAGRVRAEKKLRDYEVNLLTRKIDEHDVGGGGGRRDDESAAAAASSDDVTVAGTIGAGTTTSTSYPLHPLGTFESSFSRRNGTPRQPHLVPMARGRVRLHSQVPNAALEGIAEFSHVWLIYVFHANTDLQKSVGARDQTYGGGDRGEGGEKGAEGGEGGGTVDGGGGGDEGDLSLIHI